MTKTPAPSDVADKFMLRMPEGMRDRIARSAKSNGRSMNAEIIQLLEMHYPPDPPADEIADLIEGIFRISKGNPPKERWKDLYLWLAEYKARLLRDELEARYGDGAGHEFEKNRFD